MTTTLVAQAQANHATSLGHWFGYEVFDIDGDFHLVIHTRTYDGIKVASHYATPRVKMDALTKEGALDEAAKKTSAYARSVNGVDQ
jgi:hypothetical protein